MPKVAIIGAGLGGLLTGNLLQPHATITLFDSSPAGGRARSREIKGAQVNLGPHALYRRGALNRCLTQMGIRLKGNRASRTSYEWEGGKLTRLPTDLMTLLNHPRLSWSQRSEWLRAMSGIVLGRLPHIAFAEWTAGFSLAISKRLEVLARLATYIDQIGEVSAPLVANQLRLVLHGVIYLDGGWQQIVNALFHPLESCFLQEKVEQVHVSEDHVAITTANATRCFDVVVLALPYAKAARLAGALAPRCPGAPIAISSLDVVLSQRPPNALPLMLGVDQPIYFSEHSRYANLGGIVVHAVGYDRAPRETLEKVLDVAIPSWRDLAIAERFLPQIAVADCLPAERIDSRWHPRLFGVGDWTNSAKEAFLADAVANSALEVTSDLVACLQH